MQGLKNMDEYEDMFNKLHYELIYHDIISVSGQENYMLGIFTLMLTVTCLHWFISQKENPSNI